MSDKYFETNRETWNKKVAIHAKSDMYNMEAFKNGNSSLMKYERHSLSAVAGKSLLHLQCHFGQDTLSFARMGATCTGIDLSDEAIKLAKSLNDELNLDATFHCCNVFDVNDHVTDTFDIVFTSYGVIGWLPDLTKWATIIASRLKDGGTFYMVEFHPIVWMFDYLQEPPVLKYAYNQDEVIYEEYEGTYAEDGETKMISKEYAWNHGLGDVINALINAGLTIEMLTEHDASPYDVLPDLVKNDEGLYETKDKLYPLIYELKATKKPRE
ncbi:bifunctional 3-demethylubiquinone-9 3-methyltransferase/ 2-octaprenyl-6-hydroxy phenol methylase [Kordia sp. SMS9]|uniref:class I SAM-dependent methyltransferase n=1 Tax=Kordia sp. SMS9 TaxID=2282170 RepID=UPI000E0D1A01|nr:class I SAM-dependent methyltransferase [Kordia sp. SMS9]AXG70000.1 bifunctional 3-demethylubiquinone-9 3-methyltransferase/ 2-octaprenyl-6-hydroxy phenol methylase [Kordia sp. SMS9]